MNYFLPIIFILIFTYCTIKNIPAYDYFTKGAGDAFNLVLTIFPFICSIYIFVELLDISGLSNIICNSLSPVLSFLGIPTELSKLIFLRPFSGNGSLAIVKELFVKYGADSYIGKCASVVVGASDTIFYVTAVYFSTTKITKLKYTIPICLIASMVGNIMACFFVRLFM